MPKVSQAHLQRRRDQIVDAALGCFARRGAARTTMADIAREAGISVGLAYRYFDGKRDLLAAALERAGSADEADDWMRDAESGGEDVVALLELLLHSNVRHHDGSAESVARMGMRLRGWADAVHDDVARDEVLRRWGHHLDVLTGLVARAQGRGEVTGDLDPGAVARIMLAVHEGLNLQATLDEGVDLEACTTAILAMFSGTFAPPRAPDTGG